MTSRSRSVPTAAAMSIEWITSAKRTVTCLYSAQVSPSLIGEPLGEWARACGVSWAGSDSAVLAGSVATWLRCESTGSWCRIFSYRALTVGPGSMLIGVQSVGLAFNDVVSRGQLRP
jgi:hypothetical protein